MQPYRKCWWSKNTASTEENADTLEIEQRKGPYTHSKRFAWPSEKYAADDYMRALDWAVEFGELKRKLEIRSALNSLIGV